MLVAGVGLLYAAGVGALWAKQDSLIFHPQRPLPVPKGERFEAFDIPVDGGAVLRGVVRKAKGDGKHAALVLFGGNADEATQHAESGWDDRLVVVTCNYRGFGNSTGAPSEAAILGDAEKLFDLVAARPDVDPARIVAWGTSLGSGVAVHLASVRPVATVVLVTPYDSMTAVASRHVPFVPVTLILRHPFDSVSKAPRVRAPAFLVAGENDTLIPPSHAKALADVWGGPKELLVVKGGTHNELPGPEPGQLFWRALSTVL